MPAPFLFLFAAFCPSEATIIHMNAIFIHGLDSSSKGTKARFFREHFPEMLIPDFAGSLESRMKALDETVAGLENLILVGSSYGGLMVTLFTLANEGRVRRVVLLAPAFNFCEYKQFENKQTDVPAWLFIGRDDTVTPPLAVRPVAQQIFSRLTYCEEEDDHNLHATFRLIDWPMLLAIENPKR